jgi:hypothetical protein
VTAPGGGGTGAVKCTYALFCVDDALKATRSLYVGVIS